MNALRQITTTPADAAALVLLPVQVRPYRLVACCFSITTGISLAQLRPPALTIVFGGVARVLIICMAGTTDSAGPISYSFATGLQNGAIGIAAVESNNYTSLPENLVLDSRFQVGLQVLNADAAVDVLSDVQWLVEDLAA